jgi:hypothetical protein
MSLTIKDLSSCTELDASEKARIAGGHFMLVGGTVTPAPIALDPTAAAKSGSGHVKFADFHFTQTIDKASPTL